MLILLIAGLIRALYIRWWKGGLIQLLLLFTRTRIVGIIRLFSFIVSSLSICNVG